MTDLDEACLIAVSAVGSNALDYQNSLPAIESIVSAWRAAYGEQRVGTSAIAAASKINLPTGGNPRSLKSRLGRLIARSSGQVFDGYRITSAGIATAGSNKGTATYCLVPVKNGEIIPLVREPARSRDMHHFTAEMLCPCCGKQIVVRVEEASP